MDLLTWTRKGKDSNIYYIYTYIYILIGMLPKSQSLESLLVLFVTATYYYYLLLLLLLLSLCVWVLPLQTVCCCYDKKNRLLEHNTYLPYLTLPYSPFLSDSDNIYRDSSSIHRLVSRKNDYSGRQHKSPPRNKFQTCPRTHWNRLPFKSNSASTVAALLKDIHSGAGCCGDCYYPKSRAKPNRIYQSSRRKFTFLRSTTCLSCTNTKSINQYKKKKGRRHNNNNIKTMTHHRMGFTPSSTSSTSSSSSTTKPSATTTKKSLQRACLGGMVITPCEKCTIRTYVSLHPIPSINHDYLYPYPYPIPLIPFPSSDCIEYLRP